MRGLRTLDYNDFVDFVGAQPCQYRERLYASLRASLSEIARRYWDPQPEAIRKGVIHHGKFEKYFACFRQLILPPAHLHTRCGIFSRFPASTSSKPFTMESGTAAAGVGFSRYPLADSCSATSDATRHTLTMSS